MSCARASNSAQEKSRRSLMFTELAVLASVTPICSAMAMKRLLKISSSTGSARVDTGSRRAAAIFSSTRLSASVNVARHPRSTTTVVFCSQMIGGPCDDVAGTQRFAFEERRVGPAAVEEHGARVLRAFSAPARGAKAREAAVMSADRPVAVMPMVSITMARPGTWNPKRVRYCVEELGSEAFRASSLAAASKSAWSPCPST